MNDPTYRNSPGRLRLTWPEVLERLAAAGLMPLLSERYVRGLAVAGRLGPMSTINGPWAERWFVVEEVERFVANPSPREGEPFVGVGCVYVVVNLDTCRFKVGMTADMNRRLAELQKATDCDLELRWLLFVERPAPVEAWLHAQLAEFHWRGEWFSSDLDVIDDLLRRDFPFRHEIRSCPSASVDVVHARAAAPAESDLRAPGGDR